MNGRMYDARLGRFVQADPIVQDLYDTQSYNRYSYVMNRPLSLTDPTGLVADDGQYYRSPNTGSDYSGGSFSVDGMLSGSIAQGHMGMAMNNANRFLVRVQVHLKSRGNATQVTGQQITNMATAMLGGGESRAASAVGGAMANAYARTEFDPWSLSHEDLQRAVENAPQVVWDWPALPQPLVDFSAGLGDIASFGLTHRYREWREIDGGVSTDSEAYTYGSYVGIPVSWGTTAGAGMAINIGARTAGGARTLYHFTSASGASSITGAGQMTARSGIYGNGVYLTAVNSRFWAWLSGARSTERVIAVTGQSGRAVATPCPGTFRILDDVKVP
jgi:hypothetical protein